MTKHIGDFDASTVIYGKFTTFRPSTGASYTLGGTPALSVYKDNSTTQSTSGVTLTADFDSVTGLNHFTIDTSSDGTFYSAGSFFNIVITTGTVDGVSVTGSVVGSFTIRATSALKPTTAGRTLDVSAGGEAGIDWANVGTPESTVNLAATTVYKLSASGIDDVWDEALSGHQTVGTAGRNLTLSGTILSETTAAGTPTTTTLQLTAGSAVDDFYNDLEIIPVGGALAGQARTITDYVGATKTITIDEAWTSAPSAGDAVLIRAIHKHTKTQIADAIWDEVVDGSYTGRQSIRLINSSAFSKLSGAATTTVTIRDAGDTKNRITATVDADGNRTAVTLDAT